MNNFRKLFFLLLSWVCTFVYAEEGRVFRAITASNGLSDNSAQAIKCTKTGRMVITTLGNINFYDGSKFYHINPADEDPYYLKNYTGHYHLFFDNIHHLWLKDSHSVTCVNLTTETFISNMDSLFHELGAKDKVDDIFVDSGGNDWLVVKGKLWSTVHKRFYDLKPGLNLQDLEIYENMLLLFYEDGSLTTYNTDRGQLYYETKAYGDEFREGYRSSSLIFLHEKGFYQIRNGERGSILLHFDIQSRQWRTILQYVGYLSSISYFDHKLYVAAQVGYFTYDLASGQIEHIPELTLYGGRKLITDVNALEFDRQGGMWIGTQSRGLLYARFTDAPFRSYLINEPEVQNYIDMMKDRRGISEFNGLKANVLFIDSRRWTWVGTSTGLHIYKSPKEQPITLTRADGLLNNIIHSIIEDDMKNIWVSTSCGISCIQIERGEVRYVTSFNDDDNVPNETFMNGKVLKLDDGSIVMQGLDHVIVFNPAEFKDILAQEPIQMNPKLTSLLVNGAFVSVGTKVDGNVILTKAITRTRELNLSYDQNTISLTFSALNYSRPLQTFYRVRIPELDDGWREYSYYKGGGFVDARGLLHLPMVGLLPGTYHVELQASNVPGKWIGEPLVWEVNVNEPWWRTTGLIIFLGIVLLVLLGVNFYLFTRNTQKREKRNANEGDIISRIQNFVERCNDYEFEQMGLLKVDAVKQQSTDTELSRDFVNIMERILPYVNAHKNGHVSLHELVELTNLDVKTFYQVIASNLYKSPRMLVLKLRLQKAQQLLLNTDMPLEDIADQCLFASPNYFISSFYHQYKMTPREYRLTT